MKLKYYLRGAGLGIIFATLVMICAGSMNKSLTDEEIKLKASELGMIMPESETAEDTLGTDATE